MPPSRPVRSCSECKRRKIRCDRVFPCTPCSLRGCQDTCQESTRHYPAGLSGCASNQEVSILRERIEQLESTVTKLSAIKNEQTAAQYQQPSTSMPSTSSSSNKSPQIITVSVSPGQGSDTSRYPPAEDDEQAALLLEDLAMGNQVNLHKGTERLADNKNAHLSPPEKVSGLKHLSNRQHTVNPKDQLLAFFAPHFETFILPAAVSKLPPSKIGSALIDYFFENVDWFCKVIHEPSFRQEFENFWKNPTKETVIELGIDRTVLYFTVLCLSIQHMEKKKLEKFDFTVEVAANVAKDWYSFAEATLVMTNYLQRQTLQHLQIMVLLGVYAHGNNMVDAHWSILGTCIKIAQNLGISRLGDEQSCVSWPDPWKSFIARETGRRIWWQLIFIDWSWGSAHGLTYLVHPAQNFASYPSNIHDSDMNHDTILDTIVKPIEVPTKMTFTVARLNFLEIYRQVMDYLCSNRQPEYPVMLKFSKSVHNAIESLPPHLQVTNQYTQKVPGASQEEFFMLQLVAHSRNMRIHRPYLYRGYTDPVYATSTIECVGEAEFILNLLCEANKAGVIIQRWWLSQFYILAAAIVTFVDLINQKNFSSEDLNMKRNLLFDTIGYLSQVKLRSTAAEKSVDILERLLKTELAAPEKHVKNGPSDRKDAGVLFEAVKDVMISAGVVTVNHDSNGDNAHMNEHGSRPHTGLTNVSNVSDGQIMNNETWSEHVGLNLALGSDFGNFLLIEENDLLMGGMNLSNPELGL